MPAKARITAGRAVTSLDDLGDDAGADGAAAFADRKRRAPSIATGLIRDTTILMLSPGITISTPSGNVTAP